METASPFGTADGERPVAHYRQLAAVGEDSAARYLIGTDDTAGERVAIVIARPRPAATADIAAAQALARVAAAQRAAAMPIDAIAPVRAVGRTAGGHPFVVSALGGGLLLSEFDGLEMSDALLVLADAARVLAAAHARGAAHGSISAHTILLTGEGVVQLHGFGVAAALGAASERALAGAAREDVRALARVSRDVLSDVWGEDIPLPVAALIGRAESQEASVSAQAFAQRLARAAGAEPWEADDLEPDASDGSRQDDPPRGSARRLARRFGGALVAAMLLLLPFGDVLERGRGGDPLAGREAPRPPEEEQAAAVAPDDSSGFAGMTESLGGLAVADTADRTSADQRSAARSSATDGQAPDEPDGADEPVAPVARAEGPEGAERLTRSIVRPAPPVLEGAFATVAADTRLTLIVGERVCAATHGPGRRVSAALERAVPVPGSAGLPAGAEVTLMVTSIDRGRHAIDAQRLGLALLHIVVDGVAYPADAAVTAAHVERVRRSSGYRPIGGTGGSAELLGRILGPDEGSRSGLTGTIVTLGTRGQPGCIPAGGVLALRLTAPLRMPLD